jgi:hypothetical protein
MLVIEKRRWAVKEALLNQSRPAPASRRPWMIFCDQFAPFSVQDVVQVVVVPFMQSLQTATHCFMSLGSYFP